MTTRLYVFQISNMNLFISLADKFMFQIRLGKILP